MEVEKAKQEFEVWKKEK